jgi:hypothetical protein
MTSMDPKQAYLAVVAFLKGHWERHPVPGDFGDFYDMCRYVPGRGTRDPAMWSDWLAAIRKVQSGVEVPDPDREAMSPETLNSLSREQAYQALFEFIREYWERVSHPAEIGNLLGQMRYMPGAGTADPEMWKRWLAAIERVQASR